MFLWRVKTNMSHYNREQRLRETLNLHEFKRESAELEEWIAQQTQIAASKDFGSDYENALVRLAIYVRPPVQRFVTVLHIYLQTTLHCTLIGWGLMTLSCLIKMLIYVYI